MMLPGWLKVGLAVTTCLIIAVAAIVTGSMLRGPRPTDARQPSSGHSPTSSTTAQPTCVAQGLFISFRTDDDMRAAARVLRPDRRFKSVRTKTREEEFAGVEQFRKSVSVARSVPLEQLEASIQLIPAVDDESDYLAKELSQQFYGTATVVQRQPVEC